MVYLISINTNIFIISQILTPNNGVKITVFETDSKVIGQLTFLLPPPFFFFLFFFFWPEDKDRCTAAGKTFCLLTTTPMIPRVLWWPNGTPSGGSPSSRLWQLRAEFAEGNRSVRHRAPIGTSDWHEHVSFVRLTFSPNCRVDDLLFIITFCHQSCLLVDPNLVRVHFHNGSGWDSSEAASVAARI